MENGTIDITFGNIFDAAFVAAKKRYLPQLAATLIIRVMFLAGAAVCLIAAFIVMDNADTSMGGGMAVSITVMGVAFAAVFLLFVFLDTLVTVNAAALTEKKFGRAALATLKNVHKIFVVSLAAAACYLLIIFILYIIIGLVFAQFSPVEISAMVANLTTLVMVIAAAVIGVAAFLLVNPVFMFFAPLLATDGNLPFFACLDVSFKSAFKKGRKLKLLLFNTLIKSSLILFYIVVYNIVGTFTELPHFLTTDTSVVNQVLLITLRLLITYLIGSFAVPLYKCVVCSLNSLPVSELTTENPQPKNSQTAPPRGLTQEITGVRRGSRIAATAIDVTVQTAVLTGFFYGAVRFLARDNPYFTLSLNIGLAAIVLLFFAAALFALNVLIRKTAKGAFVGKRVMDIKISAHAK